MDLAGTFEPLLPLTLIGSMTLKVYHVAEFQDPDETYRAASHTSFRKQHGSKARFH